MLSDSVIAAALAASLCLSPALSGMPDAVPPAQTDTSPVSALSATAYQKLLGHGMDVDWSKTKQGRTYYRTQTAVDFRAAGVDHVRIRVKDALTPDVLAKLEQQIDDCLDQGIIPILAYQADAFKKNPTPETRAQVVAWWRTAAVYFQDKSHLLAFDLLIESTDALNHDSEALNALFEDAVAAIRQSNPTRILMISPRMRSDPAYLSELRLPTQGNGYLMAEWHFYAAGPSKTNERKQWTTGTAAERQKIQEKIALAAAWQRQTGVPTWVGAWMPGNYNDGDDYTVAEQLTFADFVCTQLDAAGIPFAVNSDTKFYDREAGRWYAEMAPLRARIFGA